MTEGTAADSPVRRPVRELPSALDRYDLLEARLNGRIPAIFLDYDGTLTPIVERPELAILSEEGRDVVKTLASKRPVAVVSGRDRPDVQKLVGIGGLVFAGSHGFDIVTPDGKSVDNEVGGDVTGLLDQVEAALRGLVETRGVQALCVECPAVGTQPVSRSTPRESSLILSLLKAMAS